MSDWNCYIPPEKFHFTCRHIRWECLMLEVILESHWEPTTIWQNECHSFEGGLQSLSLAPSSIVPHRLLCASLRSSWSQHLQSAKCQPPSLPLDNIRVMVIVWRLRGNIIRTAPCWVVWHSQQHTHMSNSYRSNRLGLSHWDPYAMHRGGCLELYYCNMVEWSWWDSGSICKTN